MESGTIKTNSKKPIIHLNLKYEARVSLLIAPFNHSDTIFHLTIVSQIAESLLERYFLLLRLAFIHSLFTEYLQCVRPCSKTGGQSNKQYGQNSCPYKAYSKQVYSISGDNRVIVKNKAG